MKLTFLHHRCISDDRHQAEAGKPKESESMMSAMTMRVLTAVLLATTAILSSSAAPAKTPLTREELKMARECLKGNPCYLTCNRAADAGRNDLIRKGACGE